MGSKYKRPFLFDGRQVFFPGDVALHVAALAANIVVERGAAEKRNRDGVIVVTSRLAGHGAAVEYFFSPTAGGQMPFFIAPPCQAEPVLPGFWPPALFYGAG
jgi:hypothetical protein